ncbi:hypothetical protein MBLNU230_g2272t1 [Neophaeotheca triangularis]
MDPYAQAHAAYQTQQYGQQQQQQHAHNGFYQNQQPYGQPPAKKAKTGGGMVITRYAPPPGYKGQAQPPNQPPAHQSPPGWPPAPYGSQPHPYGQYSHPGYPPQYPQTYPPPQYPGYPPQHPQYGYQYPTPAGQPVYSETPQPPVAWQAPPSVPPSSTPAPPSGSTVNHQHQHSRHNSVPSQHHRHASVTPGPLLDGNGDDMPPEDVEDEDTNEFTAECYFSRHPDLIDGSLSLGMIEAHYAEPVKRALPSTWKEAEVEVVAPRVPHPLDDECVSDYFTKAKLDENLQNVRQTGRWSEAKNDLMFTTFPAVSTNIVRMPELLATYRYRHDPGWYAREQSSTPSMSAASSRSATPSSQAAAGADRRDMELDDDVTPRQPGKTNNHYGRPQAQTDMLNHLDHSLHYSRRNSHASASSHARSHSRTSSQAPGSPSKYSRPQILPALKDRDQAQEDILAALGVTGSPQTLYPTPDPARPSASRENSAAPENNHNSTHNNSRSNSVHSVFHGYNARFPPPPPPPEQTNRSPSPLDPWRVNGYAQSRPHSSQSQHTAAGSDFEPAQLDLEATPRAKNQQQGDEHFESRKRALEEIEEEQLGLDGSMAGGGGGGGGDVKQSVETAPTPPSKMQFRRQPKIHAAYG